MKKSDASVRGDNNFWSGFSFGIVFGAGALFMLGTKHGRETLKKLIDSAEGFDGVIGAVIDELGEASHKQEGVSDSHSTEEKPQHIVDVLDKIRSVLPSQKQVKQYFVKDGKLLK